MKKLIYQTALFAYVNAICFSPHNIIGIFYMIPKIHMSHTTDFKGCYSLKGNGTSIYKSIINVCYTTEN